MAHLVIRGRDHLHILVIRGRDHLHILVIRGRAHLAMAGWSRPLITRMYRWSRPAGLPPPGNCFEPCDIIFYLPFVVIPIICLSPTLYVRILFLELPFVVSIHYFLLEVAYLLANVVIAGFPKL